MAKEVVSTLNLKAKIEAVLFLTAKPIKAQALARIVNADVQAVRQCILELVHDYEERQGGLEIADEDGYSFQVKDEYAALMDEFLPVEMSAALIRTLSAIAIKQPITQSEIIRIRGAGAYEHIKELVNRDLISKREEQGGRSPLLSITKKFQEYFRLTKEGKDLRTYLKRQVRKANAADAADAAAAAGQLVIPNVVSNPEAENQLNHGIFLETADYADGGSSSFEPLAAGDEIMGGTVPELSGSDALVPAVPPTAEFDEPAPLPASIDPSAASQLSVDDGVELATQSAAPIDSAASGNETMSPASVEPVMMATINESTAPSNESSLQLPAETTVAASSIEATETISNSSDELAKAGSRTKSGPGKTLSKLEKAAKSKEPKPVPVVETDVQSPAAVETSSMEVLTAAPPDAVPIPSPAENEAPPPAQQATEQVPAGSSEQGRSSIKKEPPIGTGKKSRQVGTDKLQELMNKQKQFEKQLKLGLFHGDEGEIILDFEPPAVQPTPPIEKAV